jgi:hypothetical protein
LEIDHESTAWSGIDPFLARLESGKAADKGGPCSRAMIAQEDA